MILLFPATRSGRTCLTTAVKQAGEGASSTSRIELPLERQSSVASSSGKAMRFASMPMAALHTVVATNRKKRRRWSGLGMGSPRRCHPIHYHKDVTRKERYRGYLVLRWK